MKNMVGYYNIMTYEKSIKQTSDDLLAFFYGF